MEEEFTYDYEPDPQTLRSLQLSLIDAKALLNKCGFYLERRQHDSRNEFMVGLERSLEASILLLENNAALITEGVRRYLLGLKKCDVDHLLAAFDLWENFTNPPAE